MGYSATSYVVIGAKLSDVLSFKREEVPTGKTKYDENSGDPYPEVEDRLVVSFNGKSPEEFGFEFEGKNIEDEWDAIIEFGWDYARAHEGLCVVRSNAEPESLADAVVGIINAEITPGYNGKNLVELSDWEGLKDYFDDAEMALEQYGYEGQIRAYLVVYESY